VAVSFCFKLDVVAHEVEMQLLRWQTNRWQETLLIVSFTFILLISLLCYNSAVEPTANLPMCYQH
jgi:hypothetical protein